MFTQPLMYKAIKAHPTTLALYEKRLIDEGTITPNELAEMKAALRAAPERRARSGRQASRPTAPTGSTAPGPACGRPKATNAAARRRCRSTTLKKVGAALTRVPADFHLHKTIQRLLQQKAQMIETGEGIDWATAEALAFGTLLDEGYPRAPRRPGLGARHVQPAPRRLRRSGNRRALLSRCEHLRRQQGEFEVVDSFLSEEAALGFEYGYTLAEPKALVLWEAQFGDFVNGAQVMIDQFIASGEKKWLRMSGLVMLLPHGYEGQGPEHSSARLERFLQLCAEDNIQVGNFSTPANYFHVAAPPDPPQLPQAADPDDAEVAAASQALRLAARRRWGRAPRSTACCTTTRNRIPARPVKLVARRQDQARRALLGQGLLRPARGARKARHRTTSI